VKENRVNDYSVYDAETTIRNNKKLNEYVIGAMKASPFHPDNFIVVEGWGEQGQITTSVDIEDRVPATNLLVGQNIKFDMLYMLRFKPKMMEWVKDGGGLWCTMLAEYLLTAQQGKFVSLDKLSIKYGGVVKDDRIKEFWEQDIDTTDIPMDMLVEYLEGDVRNTEIVYKAQHKAAERLGMLPLLESQMEALLATTLMEYNGMKFDVELANKAIVGLEKKQKEVVDLVLGIMQDESPVHESFQWNPLSNQQLSAYLFGGDVKYVIDMPVLDDEGNVTRYKGGQRKGEIKKRKEEQVYTLSAKTRSKKKLGANGYYPVGDDALKELPSSPLLRGIAELRDLSKQIKTYFKGYSKLVWTDGCIHGSLNHTKTETGRLSSSSPNLQNISGKETEV
jgi:DNA polymerase I-like protein with 3'-5' exonuclease and polymerase domains